METQLLELGRRCYSPAWRSVTNLGVPQAQEGLQTVL